MSEYRATPELIRFFTFIGASSRGARSGADSASLSDAANRSGFAMSTGRNGNRAMRHARSIDLGPSRYAIDPEKSIGHLRLADLGQDKILGARCAACDHNNWVNRWEIARKWGGDTTLDQLRSLLCCSRCDNKGNNGWRLGRIDRDSEWTDVQSLSYRSRV